MKAEKFIPEAQQLASPAQSKSFCFSEKYPQNTAWQLTAGTALLEDPSWVPGTNLQPSLTLTLGD